MFGRFFRTSYAAVKSQVGITITRFCYSPIGTFGILTYGDFSAYTVERSWENNAKFISCIPDGEYTAKWYDSPKFGRTLAVEGNGVSIYESSADRFGILFHAGNWPEEFSGCIGLGQDMRCINGSLGITTSRKTVDDFLNYVNTRGHDNIPLRIIPMGGTG